VRGQKILSASIPQKRLDDVAKLAGDLAQEKKLLRKGLKDVTLIVMRIADGLIPVTSSPALLALVAPPAVGPSTGVAQSDFKAYVAAQKQELALILLQLQGGG